MKTYDKFLEYYDQIVRGINSPLDDEVEFLIKDVIEEHKPGAKTILETACGTGTVARELIQHNYDVTGLDINEKMLAKAKTNIGKNAKLIHADMTDFELNKTFDVLLCNYNSICHLLKWEDWQKFISMAEKHLEKDGLLVFDIVTLFEFENITKEFAQFYTFGDDNVCLEMFKKQGFYEWLIKIYEKSEDERFDLTTEVVQENSFPISKIEKELKAQGFKILEKTDFHYGEVTAQSERVYFICKKK
ncbi:MAG: class I SAM-dependent methyltransferase [Candidatus Gracilibacteria bacterium]|nr:class I SAM-dependent methyltransferase [Candidatus Gracilibacteria bacterium]